MKPYYEDDLVTLFHGDCREILPTLGSVDHVITDPPYSEHVHSSARRNRMKSANDRGGKYGADLRRNIDLGFTHLDADLRAFCADQFAGLVRRWALVFSDIESAHLWRTDMQDHGLKYVRTGIWHKQGSTPQFSGDRPANAVEAITVAHGPGRTRWNGGGRHGFWSVPIVLERGKSGEARVHTTQKPLSLMAALIADFTDSGELILDPFGGSGTTALAAAHAGRRCVVIEQQEKYADVIATRMQNRNLTLDFEEPA